MPEPKPKNSDINHQQMAPAPFVPSYTQKQPSASQTPAQNSIEPCPQTVRKSRDTSQVACAISDGDLLNIVVEQSSLVTETHKEYIERSVAVHKRFLDQRNKALAVLMDAVGQIGSNGTASNHEKPPNRFLQSKQPPSYLYREQAPSAKISPLPPASQSEKYVDDRPVPTAPIVKPASVNPVEPIKRPSASSEPSMEELPASKLSGPETSTTEIETPNLTSVSIPETEEKEVAFADDSDSGEVSAMDALRTLFKNPIAIEPKGPSFNKDQLKILASGKISEVFGPLFKQQDDYAIQVRLPEPPLLLVDRITGVDAVPGSMGKGIMWTETDVTEDAWYLHDIYMPGGISIESGQCDLTLISYLGIDFFNKGERAYRLLGCDLMYYGSPPKVGDTLCYQIHVDGHANMGAQRMFFFHYDCRVNGELRLSVRNGQAAFITPEEAENAGGVLWKPETGEHKPLEDVRLDPPEVVCTYNTFSREQVKAFAEGRAYECFGPGFENLAAHSKTPKIPSGMMQLLHEVTAFDPKGGPWKRGYIRIENKISPDDWFLPGHFKNDPCMPGTLMADACMQTLAFYMAAMGFTVKRDGWRFDPVPNEIYQAKCRSQVTPKSKDLIYEAFIEEVEIVDGLYPTVFADVTATCDGKISLHIRRLGIRLVPDFPLDCWPHLLKGHVEKKPVAVYDGFEFGYKSLLSCAWGKPSDAFGELGKHFDSGRHIARLPSPPYHFMTRVAKVDATMASMTSKGEIIEVEYDVPNDAWYFDENGNRTMPFCVLMEVALQPCGWLAVFEGGVAVTDKPLLFRNLDGTGTQHVEVVPDTESILTRTTLVNIAKLKDVALFRFEVECFAGDTLVYDMKTEFGFFLREAFEQQLGLPMTEDAKTEALKTLHEPSDFLIDLTTRPARYCGGEIRMPKPMLLMLDRVTGYWPEGGGKGLGRLRAEKDVNVNEWFFKAHFFQDPVQPGSLGVEALFQLLQFYMLHENMAKDIENPRFEPILIGKTVTWKYRGQVVPKNKMIMSEINIVAVGKDDMGPFAEAEGWLWVDDLRIYYVKDMRMRIVSGSPTNVAQ